MTLREKINEQFNTALKSKDKTSVSTFRLILAAIKERDIANRTGGKKEEVKDPEIIKVLRKMKKQRQESADLYKKGRRQELLEVEEAEIKIIDTFLPKQLNEEETKKKVTEGVDLKKLKKAYEKNEDKNHHTENYLLLAKAFGTSAEVKKVQEILKRNAKEGSTSKADNDWMYKNINPYYNKIRNEEVEIDEGTGLQLKMAFDDAGIKVKGTKGGKLVIDKKDKKKAEDVISKQMKKNL